MQNNNNNNNNNNNKNSVARKSIPKVPKRKSPDGQNVFLLQTG